MAEEIHQEGICPYCDAIGDLFLTRGAIQQDQSGTFKEVNCTACGNVFREYYRIYYTSTRYLTEDDK